MSPTDPPQYPIESVDNALKLILLLGEQQEIRLTDAGTHLGVATSTAHRLLAMLTWRGFVRQDPVTKTYGPGPALTTVAFSVLRRMDIPRLAQPILDDLVQSLGETAIWGRSREITSGSSRSQNPMSPSASRPVWEGRRRRTAHRPARCSLPS